MKAQLFHALMLHQRELFDLFVNMCWLTVIGFFATLTTCVWVVYGQPLRGMDSDEDE